MSTTKSTELKLKSMPTGGVDAATSPYYRRLLSAGYKGELQGAIGGGSLYGTMGLIIGGIVAVPLFFLGVPVAAPFILMGLTAGTGALVGATSFGAIGSTAAINAESADLTEQRRYLLDRYNELPEGPEGDRQAIELKQQLVSLQGDPVGHPSFFHWKTVAICAIIGAALTMAMFSPLAAPLLAESAIFGGIHTAILSAVGSTVAASAVGMAMGGALGALTGAVVGIDRFYIRKWFDVTEGVVHASSHNESALAERGELVERLRQATKDDNVVKETLQHAVQAMHPTNAVAMPHASTPAPVKPDNKVTQAAAHEHLVQHQPTMNIAP